MLYLVHLVVFAAALLLAAPYGYATPVQYVAHLSGANENPANASPGTGIAFVTIDTALNTLSIMANFSGLTTNVSDAHIHCCIAPPGNVGVAVPGAGALPGFPLGATSGMYARTFNTEDAATYRAAFIANPAFGNGSVQGAEAALAAGLANGRAYFNIHTCEPPCNISITPIVGFPAGEIRGFLQAVPEPGTLGLLAAGMLSLVVVMRKRRR